MRSYGRVALAALVVGALPGAAQEPGPGGPRLELEEVVASALRTHPALGRAAARLSGAEAGAGQARATRLPAIGLAAQGTRHQEPMVVAPLHGFDPTDPPGFDETLYQGHASAEYTLFDGGARGARIRAAEAVAASAAAGVETAREEVLAEAVSAYLSVLSALEVRRAHDHQVEALEAELERSELLLAEGKSARVAVLRTRAALSLARAERAAADEGLELSRRRLARASGLEAARIREAVLAPVAGVASPPPSRDALVEAAMAENAGLRAARRRAEAAESRVGVARGALLPTVAASGRYSAFGAAEMDPVLEWQAGVQVSYPVFTGGARARRIEGAAAEAEEARADAELVARSVADAVDAALLAYRSSAARVEALEAAVEQSREVARIQALALEAGSGTQTDFLLAEAALLEAEATRAEARQSLVETRVGIARVTGRLTPDWLARLTGGTDR